MFYYLDPTMILLIPAILFTLYAQMKVSRAYGTYLKVRNKKGITGKEAARIILDANGCQHVPVEVTQGKLSDHYDPKEYTEIVSGCEQSSNNCFRCNSRP